MSALLNQAAFEASLNAARAAGQDWLADRRAKAAQVFATLGLPNRKTEAWRWTDLRPLHALKFDAVTQPPRAVPDLGVTRIDLVDGLAASSASVGGLQALTMAEARAQWSALLDRHYGFAPETACALGALNVALADGGVAIRAAKGDPTTPAIHLNFQTSGAQAVARSRSLIVVDEDASLTLIETHGGPATSQYFAHHGCDIVLGARARLTHIRLQNDGAQAVHLADAQVSLGAEAQYESVSINLGGRLSRHDLGLRFEGEGAKARLLTSYLATGERHVDHTSRIDHAVPHCQSEQIVKGVVSDTARGVFQGKVLVRHEAQKTDARQLTRALVLSDRAEINHKPELEIYADDVVCAHGATAGDLDEAALFYLESRGIPRADARLMLVRAFLADALDGIADATVNAALTQALDQALLQLGGGRL